MKGVSMLKSIGLIAVCATLLAATTAGAAALIDGGDIRDNSVTGQDIRNGTLRMRDIADGATERLRGQDGAKGDTGAQGAAGPAGAQGVKGDTGATGAAGADGADGADGEDGQDGVTGYGTVAPGGSHPLCESRFVASDGTEGPAGSDCQVTTVGFHDITVRCPSEKEALAGGLETLNEHESPKVTLHGSHPAAVDDTAPFSAHAWEVEFTIEAAGPMAQAHVVCAEVG
jgi:Collagen triple helix repeat (20 copies)